jgi:hypothetical protein
VGDEEDGQAGHGGLSGQCRAVAAMKTTVRN